MAAYGLNPVTEENFSFMTCILKVNTRSPGWAKTVMKVLKNINGVRSFRMDEDGTVGVSGTVNPNLLLKMLDKEGKKAELCWFQFGECSSNLYMPNPPPQIPNNFYNYHNYSNNGGYYNSPSSYYGYGDDRYLQYNRYGPKRPFSGLYLPSNNLNVPSPTSNSHASHVEKSLPTSGKGISCCSLM